MTLLQLIQAAGSVSVAMTLVWSVIKITRAITEFIAFCTRVLTEHDTMWKDYEHRRDVMQQVFDEQSRELGASAGG